MSKEEAKEIDALLNDAVDKMCQMSIKSLNMQFDILERFLQMTSFKEPTIPIECQESYCKLVNQDITKSDDSSIKDLIDDEEILKVISEINEVQDQTSRSYSELCHGLSQSSQLMQERKEIEKQLVYYHEHNKKLDFVQVKLHQLSINFEETIKSLIEQGLNLHHQYTKTKKAYEDFFEIQQK